MGLRPQTPAFISRKTKNWKCVVHESTVSGQELRMEGHPS
jgi:hypothetical protein